MNVYANIRKYDLRYTDFDFKDDLKLSALLALTQESACASADELGFGYDDLKPKGLGFIVANTHCRFLRPVLLGDSLTVETWPLPPRHVIFERDYKVQNGRGEEVARLASRWCLVDLATFSLLSPEKLGKAHECCPYRDEKALDVASWKIPDHYMHVNNTRYPDLFMDCFSMDELAKLRIASFAISYLKQIKAGSEVTFTRDDGENCTILEAFSGGELCTQLMLLHA